MRRMLTIGLIAGATVMGSPPSADAQDEADFLEVGAMAPDFELVGATRYGILEEPVRLSDFRGEAVVLAFFFRVRTPG